MYTKTSNISTGKRTSVINLDYDWCFVLYINWTFSLLDNSPLGFYSSRKLELCLEDHEEEQLNVRLRFKMSAKA